MIKKNKIYLIMAMAALGLVSGCSEATLKDAQEITEDVVQEVADQAENIADIEDEHVLKVKYGYPENYPDVTFGEAFDNFFAMPTWKYFKADTGEDVVEFTGYCTYQDAEVKARLQFILNDDDTFSTGALSFNDVPQSMFITSAMLEKAFEQYMQNNIVNDSDSNSGLNDESYPQTTETTAYVSVYDAAGKYVADGQTLSISIYSEFSDDGSVGNVVWTHIATGTEESATLYTDSEHAVVFTLNNIDYKLDFFADRAVLYDMDKNVTQFQKTESYQS